MFQSARIKLTVWYVVISMTISVFFSCGILYILHRELARNERRMRIRYEMLNDMPAQFDPAATARRNMAESTKRAVALNLFQINLIIVAISSLAGYFLAGRTLEPIQVMVAQQNQFVADASHELRTPLTALRTAIEVHLRDKKMTLSQARAVLFENLEDVNKLHRLSEHLLALASFKTNGMSFDDVNLKRVVSSAVQAVSYQAKAKKIAVKPALQDIVIKADEKRLADALVILLDNALKYSPEKTTVQIKLHKAAGHAVIAVTDQGAGIAKKDQQRIFERFYRADTSRKKTSSAGYGLGLAIARETIQAHGGTIHVKSTEGKGSTFTVTLPIKQSV